jgi:hypothetical protein
MSSFMTSRWKSTTSKNIEAKLPEKENEIQLLQQRDSVNTNAIANLSSSYETYCGGRGTEETCILYICCKRADYSTSHPSLMRQE